MRRTEEDIRKATDPAPHGHLYFLCIIRYLRIVLPNHALLLKQLATMKSPSCFWLPLIVSALIRTVQTQALGADPSIQAPAATIAINTTLTVNLFGVLPPFTVQVVQSDTNAVVQVICKTPHPLMPNPCDNKYTISSWRGPF